MKVSAQTQTDDDVDGDSNLDKGSPGLKSSGSREKDQVEISSSQDPVLLMEMERQRYQYEIEKLEVNHEQECSRLQSNIDFWKEKCDQLIREKKDMLEQKTRLHKQLEDNMKTTKDHLDLIKSLSFEVETLTQQLEMMSIEYKTLETSKLNTSKRQSLNEYMDEAEYNLGDSMNLDKVKDLLNQNSITLEASRDLSSQYQDSLSPAKHAAKRAIKGSQAASYAYN